MQQQGCATDGNSGGGGGWGHLPNAQVNLATTFPLCMDVYARLYLHSDDILLLKISLTSFKNIEPFWTKYLNKYMTSVLIITLPSTCSGIEQVHEQVLKQVLEQALEKYIPSKWTSAVQCRKVQCSAVKCSALQYCSMMCSAVKHIAVMCSVVQCSGVHCTALDCLDTIDFLYAI